MVIRELRFLLAAATAIVAVATLNACANPKSGEKNVPTYVAEQAISPANTLSGNYLAGRFAQKQQDWNAAQTYIGAVAGFDHDNSQMAQRAFLLSIGAKQYDKSRDMAKKFLADGYNSELALIYLACDALAHDDYATAQTFVEKLPDEGFGDYTKPLLSFWILAGQGKKDEALALLGAHAAKDDPAYNIHAGLLAEMTGDMAGAAAHYKSATENGLTLQSAMIVSRFFARNGHPETAKMIYSGLGKLYPFNPFENALETTGASSANITHPADGAAYAIFDIATLLYERKAYDSAQIYGSIVQLLSPQSPFTYLMMGDIAAISQQYDQALADYNAIDANSPLYWLSRMRVAELYDITGRLNDASDLLTSLSKKPEMRIQALVTLGDIYRRNEKFSEALTAYDEALSGIKTLTEEHWPVIYARGMALERLNNWDRAEKDLLKALEFQPDNPLVLNYIGYSWAEKGVNIDKAIDYIRRAVEMRPDDGYILDSLGWALFKAGQHEEAVTWMEKAVEHVPADATILDHLGDVYWEMGRKTEARFQWKRAQDLTKDTAFKTGLSVKIRQGIEPRPATTVSRSTEAKL